MSADWSVYLYHYYKYNVYELQEITNSLTFHNVQYSLVHNYFYRKVHGKTVVNGSGKVEKYCIGVAAVKNYFTVAHFIIH